MIEQTVALKKIRMLDERVFPELLKNNYFLICIHKRTGKSKRASIKTLYYEDREFWLKDSLQWMYYIDSHFVNCVLNKIRLIDLSLINDISLESSLKSNNELQIQIALYQKYSIRIKKIPSQTMESLKGAVKKINKRINSKNIAELEKNKATIEASFYSHLINKKTIEEILRLTDAEAKKTSFQVSQLTEEIISSIIALLNLNVQEHSYFHTLMTKSNGVTLRHMVRTFILSYRFILYINDQLENKTLRDKIQLKFQNNYSKWYGELLPHIAKSDLSLGHVFKGGMKIVEDEELKIYCAGFLLHDIGKQRYMEYYEGTDEYDRIKVESHAKTGYRMLLQKTSYSEKIAAIAGYHHEYYGHESGYGYYRELCSLMKLDNANHRQDSCISYNLEDLQKFSTLAYMPVKILEIVDVYDAIRDPNRSYKFHMDTSETLKYMRKEFLVDNHKLDLILFDIFKDFIKEGLRVIKGPG